MTSSELMGSELRCGREGARQAVGPSGWLAGMEEEEEKEESGHKGF